jgi:hypothetical protein
MNILKISGLLFASILLLGCGNDELPPVEVMKAEFGVYSKDANGKFELTPTKVVPRKLGQSYAWVIRYRGNQEEIRFHEVIVLEKKTKWGVSSKEGDVQKVKFEEILDGRGLVVTRTIKNDGLLAGAWSISQEDSAGKASIRVFIGKKLIKEFNFEIKDEEAESK